MDWSSVNDECRVMRCGSDSLRRCFAGSLGANCVQSVPKTIEIGGLGIGLQYPSF